MCVDIKVKPDVAGAVFTGGDAGGFGAVLADADDELVLSHLSPGRRVRDLAGSGCLREEGGRVVRPSVPAPPPAGSMYCTDGQGMRHQCVEDGGA